MTPPKKSTKIKFELMYYHVLRIATKDYKKVIYNKELEMRCKIVFDLQIGHKTP